MIILFKPAIILSETLNFKMKFMLLMLICAVPLLTLFSIVATNQWERAERIQYSLQAAQYIAPLRNLSEHIAQTRGMTNAYIKGAEEFHSKIIAKRRVVDKDFTSLTNVNKRLGNLLMINGQVTQLKVRWNKITAQAFDEPASDVFNDYSVLITDIIDFMNTVGRHGRLFQTQEVADSYMINSLINIIPAQVEALGILRGKGSGIIAASDFSAKNKLEIAFLADTKSGLLLAKDMRYLFSANSTIKSKLSDLYLNTEEILINYLSLADSKILKASTAEMRPADFFGEGTQTITALLNLFDAMQLTLTAKMQNEYQDAKNELYLNMLMLCIVLFSLAYLYIGIYLSIKKNLTQMLDISKKITLGDLSPRLLLTTKDEFLLIGEGINSIAQGMSDSINSVKQVSEEISHIAQSIAQESLKSANGMDTQVMELTQAATAMTQMSASVHEVAENTALGSRCAEQANEQTQQSRRLVEQTLSSINVLAGNVQEASSGIRSLDESSKDISTILSEIQGIAEQTNLLALNAAIEAARAGAQGLGFAVVAHEVRSLAKRAQDSALEIQGNVQAIQSQITSLSTTMLESEGYSDTAVECSNVASNALIEVSESVNEASNISVQIAAAVEEQSGVSEEISRSIITVTEVSVDTARGAQALADSGAKISTKVELLNNILSRYTF